MEKIIYDILFIFAVVFAMFFGGMFGLFSRKYSKKEIEQHKNFKQILTEIEILKAKGIDIRRLHSLVLDLIR